LREIYDLLRHYPSNKIVLAHWGGGLFFYSIMKKEVRDVLKNVWFDTAASPFLYDPQIYRMAVEIVGSDKILFGTDYPLISPKRYFVEMELAGLSQDSIRSICGENAVKLLSIPFG
jgi:predicted TIM-barrel fold metal-dependent hydrolase